MPASFSIRFLVAATALLGLFAITYQAAVQGPGRRPAAATGLAAGRAPADSLAPLATRVRPAAPTSSAPVETVMPPGPRPVFERGGRWARRPRLVHRYVGTVGGQPATALLDWQNPDSISGTFSLHRGGPDYHLAPPTAPAAPTLRPRHRRGQVLELSAEVWNGGGWWQLHGRPGAVLRATWHDGPTGRPQRVVLRESYAGAVRVAIQTEWVHGSYSATDSQGSLHSAVPAVKYEFLHLPNPAAVPPVLRPILSPGPATRRRRLLTGDYDCETSYELTVRLNEAGLFSYQYLELCSAIGSGDDYSYHNALLDLRSGRWLAPESQLVPDYAPALARLLAPHLLHDQTYWQINRDSSWRRQLTPYLGARADTLAAATRWLLAHAVPSAHEALFTGAGLEIIVPRDQYIHVQASPGATFTLFFSYRELRPLVRPGTPLARLLRARGLW